MNKMKPQFHPFVAHFSSSSSGHCKDFDQKNKDGSDKWRGKTEEQEKTGEDKSQPLINLGLEIGGSSFCNTRNSDNRERDNSFDRTVMVKKEEVEDDHDDDQEEEREECRKCSVVRFTEEQLEELKRQLLIFKYIVWGLPVPFQLLLPLWRSFSSSSVPYYSGSSPRLLALYRGNIDYHHMMDPEPGRCRRTDGKKWRCHQAVISNEKYCEKHMHRGRKRSRKLVEVSPSTWTPNLINLNRNSNPSRDSRPESPTNLDQNGPSWVMVKTPGLNNTSSTMRNEIKKPNNDAKSNIISTTPNLTNLNRNSSPSCDSGPEFPSNFDQNGPSWVVMRTPGLTHTSSTMSNEIKKRNNEAKSNVISTLNLTNLNRNSSSSSDSGPKFPANIDQSGPSWAVMRTQGLNNASSTMSNEINKQNNEAKSNIIARERSSVIKLTSSGLDFSPKSVLQNGEGCQAQRVESCKNNPETEPRCNRTDGKKWRCKKGVVPHQKYCAHHISRGKVRSEKPSCLGPSASREAQAAYGSTSSVIFSRTEQAKSGLGLDTNLNISLPSRPADPRNIIKDGPAQYDDGSSCSSEATESDESTNVWDIITLSP